MAERVCGSEGPFPKATITPCRNGPYLVRGEFALVDQAGAWLLQLRGSRAVRMQTFTDRAKAEALEAGGLRE